MKQNSLDHGGEVSRKGSCTEKDTENINSIDPLQEAIGNIGPWQWYICAMLSFNKIPVAWHTLAIVFLAPHTDFWCKRPQGLEDIDLDVWKNISSEDGSGSTCKIYVRNYTAIFRSNASYDNSDTLMDCPEFEYDRSIFTETIITQWNLVCGRSYLADFAQCVFMMGVLTGSLTFGVIADKYGRKLPLVASVIIQAFGGVGAAFSPWFELFLVFRFLDAVATGGQMMTSFVVCMEIVGGKWRTIMSVLYHVPFSLAISLLAVISYFLPDWKHYELAISFPTIMLISYWWCLPESPRWLLAVGREKEAIAILEKAAERNKLSKEEVPQKIKAYLKQQSKTSVENKGNVFDLFRTPNMRVKTICIFVNWTSCGLTFFGMHQYIGEIGNIFISVAFSGIIDLPGLSLSMFAMEKFGRRNAVVYGQLIGGFSCLVTPIVVYEFPDLAWPRVALALVGLFGMSLAISSVYLYTGELFPTVVRNAGMGASSMCSRIGSIIAPFVISSGNYSTLLPPVLFSVLPLLGSSLSLLLPETKGSDLPDTLEDGESFGKKPKKVEVIVHETYIKRDQDGV